MQRGLPDLAQEVEKEVWEDELSGGKRRRRTLQQTEYCYEADMEGARTVALWPPSLHGL